MAARLAHYDDGPSSSAPHPLWILRHHSPVPVTALAFHEAAAQRDDEDSDDDEDAADGSLLLVAGDADGQVSLSSVATYRPQHFWQAHAKGSSILGVEALDDQGGQYHRLVTHGRDHKIHFWRARKTSSQPPPSVKAASHAAEDQEKAGKPELTVTIEVNALNFCRFSLLHPTPGQSGDTAFIAVPHTLESGWIDVYSVDLSSGGTPKAQRIHTAIGKGMLSPGGLAAGSSAASGGAMSGGVSRAPITMSLHLVATEGAGLAILAGYEDGAVRLWKTKKAAHESGASSGSAAADSSAAWSLVWEEKVHRETVLSTCLSYSTDLLISTSADDRLALFAQPTAHPPNWSKANVLETHKQGRSSLAMLPAAQRRRSGNAKEDESAHIFIVGGWDGRARLYRASPAADSYDAEIIAVLRYHKESVQAVALARSADDAILAAVAGKDGRISLWKHGS
ncbi:WD40 repeat-like protein [Jaminaea rosea]|uniref:ASTRA-associated protein 1 n=1 Tax=Jaminaea rosea TaxID=1569628 RepID=A0A316UWF8_9BASI|nr:WD40 repeat-like protein [Jaminaea rosea]PWN28661.1 WD40 repeat-like protein [Jaminaea rosea]